MGGQALRDEKLASLPMSCDRAAMLRTLAQVERLFARSHELLKQLSIPEQAFMREWATEGANPMYLAWRGENVAGDLADFLKDDKVLACRENIHCEMPETGENRGADYVSSRL